jgi:long-chain acyl-CoA synthetase
VAEADGAVRFRGVMKKMFTRGGYNVYPREVEEVLMTHPDVSLAAVIGGPHESHGEEIKAIVILEEGASLTEDELVAWGKEQMAAYKYPRVVEFADALPRTSSGKVRRAQLRQGG